VPGICLIAQKDFDERRVLESMASSIKHEEWYQTDIFTTPLFGVRRVHLGIFNPEPQPIFNEDKTVAIVMDGRVYDYAEKKNELQRKGYRFSTDGDPEFCLHLYEELGTDFVKRLNGIFAIVLYDSRQQKLLVMNDRYGLRPLYYAVDGERLMVASEVKAILKAGKSRKLDDGAVADWLAFGRLLGDKTFFQGITVLPPASILEYMSGEISLERYWEFQYKAGYHYP